MKPLLWKREAANLKQLRGDEPVLALESWDGSPHLVSAEHLADLGWQLCRRAVLVAHYRKCSKKDTMKVFIAGKGEVKNDDPVLDLKSFEPLIASQKAEIWPRWDRIQLLVLLACSSQSLAQRTGQPDILTEIQLGLAHQSHFSMTVELSRMFATLLQDVVWNF